MTNYQTFNIRLEKPFFENSSAPPEDPLGELSDFEMGIRRFCCECNQKVSIQIGSEKILLFLDPDICMILNRLPQQFLELAQDKQIEIIFAEICLLLIEFLPLKYKIICTLKEFGHSSKSKHFELDKFQVLGVLRRFLYEVVQLAMDGGYIKPEEKNEFLSPAFPTDVSVVFPA